jgi:hypothetical protein
MLELVAMLLLSYIQDIAHQHVIKEMACKAYDADPWFII